eukprot:8006446-Pyramimonas_sp.AAC.1
MCIRDSPWPYQRPKTHKLPQRRPAVATRMPPASGRGPPRRKQGRKDHQAKKQKSTPGDQAHQLRQQRPAVATRKPPGNRQPAPKTARRQRAWPQRPAAQTPGAPGAPCPPPGTSTSERHGKGEPDTPGRLSGRHSWKAASQRSRGGGNTSPTLRESLWSWPLRQGGRP